MTISTVSLHNGLSVPQVGLGVFLITDEQDLSKTVMSAIESGYRHFDTATAYGNEEALGEALKQSGVPREELFLTTKVWNNMQGYEKTKEALEISLEKLGTDYIDLYLIHWFGKDVTGTWKAMEELYKAGKIKSIGVCNFDIDHLKELLAVAEIKPMINQVETHPYFPQDELRAFMDEHDIKHEAWGPLSQGKSDLLVNPVIEELAAKYEKTSAQIVLRWHLERGTIIIPKSTNAGRILENISLFDFSLTEEDMAAMKGINTETRYGREPRDLEFIEKTSI